MLLTLLLTAQSAAATEPPPAPTNEEVVVTARRRQESVQDVPIAVSVVGGAQVAATGSYNVARLQQLQPAVQFYSSNPRNSAITIRGIGAPFGLTNDGIEQGVGIYVDQVYYNRVAAAALDFVDIDRIEVLRGPQGTLYGKNTTAGAINITTARPSFTPGGRAEVSAGNYGFLQSKASVTGPVTNRLAVRLGGSATRRDGTIYNVATGRHIQAQDNVGLRGQLLWLVDDALRFTLTGDYNRQNPACCAQIYARVGTTQRPLDRQYAALTAAFGYRVPSTDPFDRLTDVDAPLSARNEIGGVSLVGEWTSGTDSLTSVTAWRYWNWAPMNDRDFTGLPINTRSQNPSRQQQYTQELRFAHKGARVEAVLGAFGFYQTIRTSGTEENGPAASRFLLSPASPLSNDPAVLNGLRADNDIRLRNVSAALFGKLSWKVAGAFTLSPGVRVNYDRKDGSYTSVVTGTASDGTRRPVLFSGPFATDPWIVAQRGVRAPQSFRPDFGSWNLSYDLTASYALAPDVLGYATYARAFKSGGVNLNGVPADNAGAPILSAGTVKPERVDHVELGLKSQFRDRRATLNLTGFWTQVRDFQANVTNGQLGVLRGYLANAGKVRVRGVEAELTVRPSARWRAYASGSFTDARYVSFPDAPCPPELSGGTTAAAGQAPGPAGVPGALSPANCDISGQWLPGVSRWAGSYGLEYSRAGRALGRDGQFYLGFDGSARSAFSSNASRSVYTDVAGYSIANFRGGFRTAAGLNLFGWVRNAFDARYFEQLAVTSGNTGLIAGQPGDPRTYGLTLATRF